MDERLERLVNFETKRQNEGIELIASENYASKDVRALCGSILTNKYAEGYPGRRYYGGCEYIDEIERIAIERAKQLFDCKFANVQPHSGSQANAAAYHALLPNGGKILSLDLNSGGHLTHGSKVSFSNKLYEFYHYKLDETGHIDYDNLIEMLCNYQVDLVLCGASAYPYIIDFERIRNIINKYKPDTYLMADIAHIAGLVAAKRHPSPFPWCDVVTSTTHKTLRGPRGGIILTNSEELAKKINSAVFPFYQGGPLEHIIAAKAQCFYEAYGFEFEHYIDRVIENTKACRDRLAMISSVKVSETENHLFLLNTLESYGITGKEAQEKLESIGITTNKNTLPGDTKKPNETSGLRIGFAAVTTRGCTEENAEYIAWIINAFLEGRMTQERAKEHIKRIVDTWKPIESI